MHGQGHGEFTELAAAACGGCCLGCGGGGGYYSARSVLLPAHIACFSNAHQSACHQLPTGAAAAPEPTVCCLCALHA